MHLLQADPTFHISAAYVCVQPPVTAAAALYVHLALMLIVRVQAVFLADLQENQHRA